jgi:hypothetical protein
VNINRKEKGEPTGERPGSLQREEPPHVLPVSERIGDQPPLEDRLADVPGRVVQHPLAKHGDAIKTFNFDVTVYSSRTGKMRQDTSTRTNTCIQLQYGPEKL